MRFPFADSREVQGDFGPQFMYTVEVGGQRDRLYASPTLHRKLEDLGLSPGQVVTITKVETEGNRKDWRVELPAQDQTPKAIAGNGRARTTQPAVQQTTPGRSGPTNGSNQPTDQRSTSAQAQTASKAMAGTGVSTLPLRVRGPLAEPTAPSSVPPTPASPPRRSSWP